MKLMDIIQEQEQFKMSLRRYHRETSPVQRNYKRKFQHKDTGQIDTYGMLIRRLMMTNPEVDDWFLLDKQQG